MKKKALHKDIRQEIKKTFPRFLSLFLMSALGVSFFSGVRAAMPDMLSTTDKYLKESNLFDLQVVSTMGLQQEDLDAVLEEESVKAAELTYAADLLCDKEGEQYVVHVMAESSMAKCGIAEGRMPEKKNEIFLDSALADTLGAEIGTEVTLYEEEKDEEDSGDEETSTLGQETYQVVGIGTSPMYLSFMTRGSASIGNGQVTGFAVVQPEAFAMEVYTHMNVQLKEAGTYEAYSDEYKAAVEKVQQVVEDNVADAQCQWRYDQVYEEASQEIADAREELEDGKATAQQELSDGRKELDDGWKELTDGETQLADGKKQIADNEATLNQSARDLESSKAQIASEKQKLADGEAQLADGKKQIADNEAALNQAQQELDSSRAALEEGQAQLEAGKAQLTQEEEKLNQGRAQLEAQKQEIQEAQAQLEAGRAQLAAQEAVLNQSQQDLDALAGQIGALEGALGEEGTPEYEENLAILAEMKLQYNQGQRELEAGRQALEAAKAEFAAQEAAALEAIQQGNAAIAQYETELEAGAAQLEAARGELEAKEAELKAGMAQLEAGEAQMADGRQQLQSAKDELNASSSQIESGKSQIASYEKQIADGEAQIASGRQQLEEAKAQLPEQEQKLADARQELEDGEKEYLEGKKEAEEEIADGEQKLAEAEQELADLELPKWYVQTRDDAVVDYSEMEDNAQQIGAIGRVFPLMFFLVAALVSLTTMTRMVEEQRGHIGTMKALGYRKADIAMKYLWYAGAATLGGGAIGILVGQKLFPYIIQVSYGIMYDCLNQPEIPYRLDSAVQALLISFVCIMAATAASCLKELKELPAQLMRPEAPKVGKRVLLEHMPFLWKRLNFTTKSTFRNIFRYKKRLFMTIFGISATMALLVTGFGLRDSIIDLAEIQYDNIQLYDAMVTLSGTDQEKADLEKWIEKEKEVQASTMVHMEMVDTETDQGSGEVYLCVPEHVSDFQEMTVLQNRTTEETYSMDDQGILLTEWMAQTLEVEKGDSISLQKENGQSVEVKVSGIVENYIMNYAYMSPKLYQNLYGQQTEYEVMYIKLTEEGKNQEQQIGTALLQQPGVYNVSYTSDQKQEINDMLQALVLVVIVLIITAALLAFVVLYNLNNVNITERRRELATLKVLGFYDQEVAAYVYHENIILTIMGIVVGVFLGIILHQYIIHTIRVDMVMFGQKVSLISFLISAVLTGIFSAFVNFVMYFKLKEIDMVESLKSVE